MQTRTNAGYYLMQEQSGLTVNVFNALSDEQIDVFANGVGGIAADLTSGKIYRVEMTVDGKTFGYHTALSAGSLLNPYSWFVRQ